MPDLTYTAQGTFTSGRLASINVCIPSEPSPGVYTAELYNLSKNTSNGVINAIFCHFRNQKPDALQHSSFDYRMNFDINKLKTHPSTAEFDNTKNDSLFLFFHNDDFNSADRDLYFNQIEAIYDEVKNHGNQSKDGLNYAAVSANARVPRKVGMSLVIR